MFKVSYSYFDIKGNQRKKELSRSTLKLLIKAFKKDLENKELYDIIAVSKNLVNYDFKKHGIKEYNFF